MKRFALGGGLLVAAFATVALADEKALKELEGTYTVTAMEKSGMPAPKEVTENVKVTIKGDEFSIAFGGDAKKAKIKADNTATPNTIDISPLDGPEKDKTFMGIYKIEKDTVTIVFAEKGDRPKEFKSDDEAILVKMKKTK